MRMFTGLGTVLFIGVLLATPGYAGGHHTMADKATSDHHDLAMYYEEEAQKNKSKALDWVHRENEGVRAYRVVARGCRGFSKDCGEGPATGQQTPGDDATGRGALMRKMAPA